MITTKFIYPVSFAQHKENMRKANNLFGSELVDETTPGALSENFDLRGFTQTVNLAQLKPCEIH